LVSTTLSLTLAGVEVLDTATVILSFTNLGVGDIIEASTVDGVGMPDGVHQDGPGVDQGSMATGPDVTTASFIMMPITDVT
jgi:hypothetical protein